MKEKNQNEEVNTSKKVKKIVGICGNVILYTILGFLFLFSIANLTIREEDDVPSLFGIGFLDVASDSMNGSNKDSFDKGDLIIVKVVKGKTQSIQNVEVGDIVTWYNYKDFPKFNTHRVVELIKDENGNTIRVVTKGDKENAPLDEPVNLSSIKSVYISKIKGLGSVIGYMRTGIGFGLTVFLPVLLFLVYQGILLGRNIIKVQKEKFGQTQEIDKEELRKELLKEILAEQEKNKKDPHQLDEKDELEK